TDAAGNLLGPVEVAVTLDTQAPAAATFDLAPSSDTGTPGDRTTAAGRVTLTGHADPETTVALAGTTLVALPGARDRFQLANGPLAVGDNVLVVEARDLAGNATAASLTIRRTDEGLGQDPVLAWNQELLESVRQDASTPPFASRAMAMVHAALFDAVSA